MKLGNLAEVYYSAAEARKRLGIDENTFQYWGKNGRITRVYLPGRKQAVYSKKEINNMAHVIEATAIAEKNGGYEYRKATLNDLEEEFRLARVIFGRPADTPEMRQGKQAFLTKNPDIDYHLYDRGNFVACLHIVPMKHQAIIDFLDNKIRAWLIHPDNVELFEPGKPLECLLLDALTTPAVEPIKRGTYASRLLANFGDTLEEWGRQGIQFSKFYGASATPTGIRIFKSADFKELEVQEDSGRITFELDVMNSDAKWLRFYKEALEQWRQQQELSSNHSSSKRRKTQKTVENIETV